MAGRGPKPVATLWPVLRRSLTLIAVGIAVAAVPPAVASASPVTDCTAHGHLTQHYTVPALRNALATMPADVQEYTNCYDVIRNQMLDQVPGGHAGGKDTTSSGSSFISTPLLIALIVVLVGGGALAGIVIQRRRRPPGDG